jgi:tRNA/tmRNA/rRNA uracil-C5-methylase (TrmA/RlmC/RlmD family)
MTPDPSRGDRGWLGEQFELTTDRLGHGGVCIGRHEGRVVFVRHALPGEHLRVRVTEDRGKGFCRAEIVDIITASAHRIDPVCPAGAPDGGAGCCDLSHTTGSHARELKSQVLAELLSRMGGVSWDGSVESLDPRAGAEPETGWRIRQRLFVDDDGRPGLAAYQSHSVVHRLDCAQPVAGMLGGLDVYTGLTAGAELAITIGDDGQRHIAQIAPPTPHPGRQARRQGRGDDRRGQAQRARSQRARSQRSGPRVEEIVSGTETVQRTIGARSWQLPVSGFWQAHRQAAAGYSNAVHLLVREAGLGASVVAWDLYGGAGVLAAAIVDECDAARAAVTVHVVETDARAIAAGEAAFADDPRIHLRRAAVTQALADLPAPTIVLADPPRAGAGREVVDKIVAAGPSAIIAVGCDPATFARDLADYRRGGYDVVALRGFDAFPLTHHVEAIALLRSSPHSAAAASHTTRRP